MTWSESAKYYENSKKSKRSQKNNNIRVPFE